MFIRTYVSEPGAHHSVPLEVSTRDVKSLVVVSSKAWLFDVRFPGSMSRPAKNLDGCSPCYPCVLPSQRRLLLTFPPQYLVRWRKTLSGWLGQDWQQELSDLGEQVALSSRELEDLGREPEDLGRACRSLGLSVYGWWMYVCFHSRRQAFYVSTESPQEVRQHHLLICAMSKLRRLPQRICFFIALQPQML